MLFLLDDRIHALTEFGPEFDVGSGKSGFAGKGDGGRVMEGR